MGAGLPPLHSGDAVSAGERQEEQMEEISRISQTERMSRKDSVCHGDIRGRVSEASAEVTRLLIG